jgi:hypothetical protein
MAQSTNVYSLNAVGYINVTAPANSFSLIACPLIASPDNTVGTVLNNGSGWLTGSQVFFYNPATGQLGTDQAMPVGSGRGQTPNTNGWAANGTNVLAPGVACWFQNSASTNITLTFVGTVPQGSLTNTLVSGYNLVSSAVPTSGDLITNSITSLTNYNVGDEVFVYNPVSGYTIYASSTILRQSGYGYNGNWASSGDPTVPNVGEGFWYQNTGAPVSWVENFSVNP